MNYDEQIDEIMDYFKFERVEIAMQALNWAWQDDIPDLPTIRQKARSYLRKVSTHPNDYSIGSGGFTAHKDGDGYLSLRFDLDSWDTNPDT